MMDGMIDVTGIDLVAFAQKVYELSKPKSISMYYPVPWMFDQEQSMTIINWFESRNNIALILDQVSGRDCNMVVRRQDGQLYIPKDWFAHGAKETEALHRWIEDNKKVDNY